MNELFQGVSWAVRIRRGLAQIETWIRADDTTGEEPILSREVRTLVLPLFTVGKGETLAPVDCETTFATGRAVLWLLMTERLEEGRSWLLGQGWQPVDDSANSEEAST